MHVGHIRSTILGDCLARTLRLLGHRVITDNHIGDWGTQFGKLLVGWKKHLDPAALKADPIAEMERLYKLVNAAGEADEKVLEEARQELVKLQGGDEENLRIWREMIALSQKQFDTIYARLGVKFDHALGESFYNPRLKPLVDELLAKGLARESEGAIAIFFDDIPQLKERPALIRKNDGGFNYATTDLATLAYRLETWHPDEIIYVTDGRQQLHFQQVFTAFRRWQAVLSEGRVTRAPNSSGEKSMGLSELAPPKNDVKLAHVWFGSILGEDGKPFKTRSGETVKLADLLDEAEERALKIVSEKNPDLPEAQRREIARVVGLGAVKYADLLPNRQSDYVFSWDKMLALQGNTAPYLQYAYTRIKSIFRKAEETFEHPTFNAQHSIGSAGRNCAGQASVEFRADAGGGGGGISSEFPVQLSLRTGRQVHVVLRKLSGAQGRRRHARFAAGVVRPDRAGAQAGFGNPRHRDRGTNVNLGAPASSPASREMKTELAGETPALPEIMPRNPKDFTGRCRSGYSTLRARW